MATRRRATPRPTGTRQSGTRRTRRRGSGLPRFRLPAISPELARSLIGIGLLLLGAVTLIALLLPGKGSLTDWWRDSIAPWFETGRWIRTKQHEFRCRVIQPARQGATRWPPRVENR